MDDQGLPIYLIWLLGKQLENVDSCPAQSLDMVFMFGHWLLSKRFQIPSVPSFLSRHWICKDSEIWRNGFCGQVEVLSAVVDSIANSVGADTIVDVGAGQVGPVLSSSVFQFCTCDPNVEAA